LLRVNKEKVYYFLVRGLTYPFSWMPYRWIHAAGRVVGWMAFYTMREYRKRTLSNLALATDLALDRRSLKTIAIQSFQNLAINCLEYPRLAREKEFSRVIRCENPEGPLELHRQGQGVIFFCGHLSNWEVLFLDGTSRMEGIAIGKSIKNKRLYDWIVSIREKNGGTIVAPKSALKEGLRALRKGAFIGIVGDQGMPDSGYSFPFLGRRAWTSTAPALLACKTQSPIFYASTRRVPGGYTIRYSDPIWPRPHQPLEKEVPRMMDTLMRLMQESIHASPGEWLWQHNRWKQQTPQVLFKRFRQDCLLVILPPDPLPFFPHLSTLREIYPTDFLTLLLPRGFVSPIAADEVLHYDALSDTLLHDYRFKLVFNFTDYAPIARHYEKLSAFETVTLPALQKLAAPHLLPHHTLSDILRRALCRPGTTWSPTRCP
jgi:KDO2-lipid IV(A) lauroyltransferase